MKPKYILYAGVNGAGKSTLYNINGNLEGLHYINLDDEIRKLGDWRDANINITAGKQVVNTIKEYIESKESFIQETTFCGNSIVRNVNNAIARGYYIEVHYVAVETTDIAIERVHSRVAKGGHGVSDQDIRRRYNQSFSNLKLLLPKIDWLVLYDNTESFRKIAVYSKGILVNKENNAPAWYKKYIVE